MYRNLLNWLTILLVLPSCSGTSPTISVVCEENNVGNAIIKWETAPILKGQVISRSLLTSLSYKISLSERSRMKARLFTSLSNGLSGVKSRAFSLRRAGFRTKCNLHFPRKVTPSGANAYSIGGRDFLYSHFFRKSFCSQAGSFQ